MPGWRIRRAMGITLTLVLLAACSTQALPSPTPTPVPSPTPSPTVVAISTTSAGMPRFDTSVCPFTLPTFYVQGKKADCGFVTVPERHNQPNARTIRLTVVRFRSLSSTPDPVPMIYLSGGPGGKNEGLVKYFDTAFTGVIGARDVIVFDPRGVGMSQPALECPEAIAQQFEDYTQRLRANDRDDHLVAAALRCRDRLVGQGIDLAAYTSAQSAADVDDIRTALGYRQVDLLGISYGTRLALTVVRDFPTIVHSILLDSVVPLDLNLYQQRAGSFDRALTMLFAACAADKGCAASYPTLEADFTAVVATLNTQPVTVGVTDPTGAGHDVLVTGDRFVGALFDWLYRPSAMEYIPGAIEQLKGGAHTLLAQLLGSTLSATTFGHTQGLQYSVVCNELVPFETPAAVMASVQGARPELRGALAGVDSIFTICAQWPHDPADPREHRAVTSDVPTLVLESGNDPVTPPAFGQRAARTLSRSVYVETPGIGHSVVANGGPCVQTIVRAFYANPIPQEFGACVTGLGVYFLTGL